VVLGAHAALGDNSGDVWVDNPGQAAGPGHENDPHLCGALDVYGSGLSASGGTFQIVSWPPTGDGSTIVASGAWTYGGTGNQVIAGPITLAPGHYKLTVNQSPVKEKVFWVCTSPQPTPTPTPIGTGAPWPFTH
jgi:hypothetical protein